MKTIALIGDSTLDNQVWVKRGMSVTEQLKRMQPMDRVINLAVDGFTTSNVLSGGYRDKAVRSANHLHEVSYPLRQLDQLKTCDHIILSVWWQ